MRMNRLLYRIVHSRSSLESKGLDHVEKTTIEGTHRKDSRIEIKELTMTFGIHDDHRGVMMAKSRCRKLKRWTMGDFDDGDRRHSMGKQDECRLDYKERDDDDGQI